MNALDRLIAAFSPQAGLRRANARVMLDQLDHRYAAGKTGRRNKGWNGRGTSANVEISQALVTLRNRAREFVRDSWAGQRILDVLVSHVIGTGIAVVPNTGSDRDDKRFSLAWEQWHDNADVEGVLDFSAMQGLALRSMVEGGDSVMRFVDTELDKVGPVPFRLRGLEGDQIDTSRDLSAIGNNVRLGVQLGDQGRRQGLWLWKDHPGDMTVSALTGGSELIAWGDLCHLYRPLRWGQVRGVTWFAPVLLTGKEMQDLTEAAIVQARTQACFAGFMKRPPGAPNPFATQTQGDGVEAQKVTRIEPGMVVDIGDSDIVFAQPSSQSNFGPVYIAGMQAMAAGAGITYDQLTGDLRQANYSSLRAGKIDFRRLVEQIQWHLMAPRMIMPIVRRFTLRAGLANMLPSRGHGYPVDLIMPANEPIDPKKDLDADISAVRAGRMSPQEFISAWGRDWKKVVADTATFFEVADKAKLALDIDGRRPLNGGVQQPPQAPDDPAPNPQDPSNG